MKKPYIVGITGGSASGKTFFLQSLLEAFPKDEICLVSQDNYYFPSHLQPKDENGIINYDTPSSIDFGAFIKDLGDLKDGKEVKREEYTFNNPKVKPRLFTFTPAPILVVEGIFVFYDPKMLDLIDLKIFIDAEEHVKLSRRITRDKEERGYDLADVLYRYEKHVAPAYEKFIKPYKAEADIIISNNKHFDKGLSVLIPFLKGISANGGQKPE